MALHTNLIILMIVFSFALYMGTVDGNGNHTNYSLFAKFLNDKNSINDQFKTLLIGLVGVGVVAGAFIIPNQWAIFGTLAYMLLGFASLPVDIAQQTGLPKEIQDFIIIIFGLMYMLALLSWFKGTPE